MEIGEKLRKLRKQKELSIVQLANLCHFTPGFISNVENGRKNPSTESLKLIADTLGVSYSYFLEDDSSVTIDKAISAGALKIYELIGDFDSWNESDKNELYDYLKVKKLLRENQHLLSDDNDN